MANRLAQATSPYLIQHAGNPVDWYPWGEEALEKARREDLPIFLSIGYAACHWCHVMAHESFENEQTARFLNEHFVSIKVDREERPDLDSIYMDALVSMTGQGGWPMSLFLSPGGEPFYGGTYFPPTPRHGMPSFRQVLEGVHAAWQNERQEVLATGSKILENLRGSNLWSSGERKGDLRRVVLDQAAGVLIHSYDWDHGGWGSAPKFPQAMVLDFLNRLVERGIYPDALRVVRDCLDQMAKGGLYDVVGGGFHRYSTDDAWRVPHFEKMLYDNAQLAPVYLHAYSLTGEIRYRDIATGTLDFLLREMTHPRGGFYSSLDADSEGVEGKYYLWNRDELISALGDFPDFALFQQAYGLDTDPETDQIILQRVVRDDDLAHQTGKPPEEIRELLRNAHLMLRSARDRRVRPGTDDKILVSWNGLALSAFSEAARYLGDETYLEAARRCASFLLDNLVVDDRLYRSWRDGQVSQPAFLEDYASLCVGLLNLYQTDGNPTWYQAAVNLQMEIERSFRDPQGGYFDTRDGDSPLILRPKSIQDNAVPSGNALAAMALRLLGEFSGEESWMQASEQMLAVMETYAAKYPTGFGYWLSGYDLALGPVKQVAILGDPADEQTRRLIRSAWASYRPRMILAQSVHGAEPDQPALLNNRVQIDQKPTAYVCSGFVCRLPVHQPDEMQAQLDGEIF